MSLSADINVIPKRYHYIPAYLGESYEIHDLILAFWSYCIENDQRENWVYCFEKSIYTLYVFLKKKISKLNFKLFSSRVWFWDHRTYRMLMYILNPEVYILWDKWEIVTIKITGNFVLHTKFCALAFSYKADYTRGYSCTFLRTS